MEVYVVPSSEYCQVPLPVAPTRAIPPITGLLSVSAMIVVPEPLLMNVARWIVEVVLLLVVPNEGFADVRIGEALLARIFMAYCC